MKYFHLAQDRGPAMGSSKHGDDPLSSVRVGIF